MSHGQHEPRMHSNPSADAPRLDAGNDTKFQKKNRITVTNEDFVEEKIETNRFLEAKDISTI